MIAAWALTVACGLAVAALLVCEAKGSRYRAAAKVAASTFFVAVPFAGAADLGSSYAILIIAGLLFGAGGDVALLGESRQAVTRGLVLFLIGHVAYIVAFAPAAELAPVPIAIGAVFMLVGALGFAPKAGKLATPVRLYSLVIGVMVAAALARPGEWLVATGAMLFAVSDLAVARQRFVTKSLANRLFGLPTYYAGQLLIAWTTL